MKFTFHSTFDEKNEATLAFSVHLIGAVSKKLDICLFVSGPETNAKGGTWNNSSCSSFN